MEAEEVEAMIDVDPLSNEIVNGSRNLTPWRQVCSFALTGPVG